MNISIKLSVALSCLVAIASTVNAQDRVEPKSVFMNVGMGFQGNRFNTSTWRPSINANIDYALLKNTTIGLQGNYYGEQIAKDSRFNSYALGLRSSYYFNSVVKRDDKRVSYYAGIGVMYYKYSYSDFEATKGKVYIPLHIGARTLFYDSYGAIVELGFNDMQSIKIGFTWILN